MIAAPIPHGETVRLAALKSIGLVGMPDEYVLDSVTNIGAHLFNAPSCVLSLVDEKHLWFKSRAGLKLRETPLEISFCGHVVASGESMVVEDTLRDERFAVNPLVIADPFVRFYAGHPLRSFSGEVLGTVSVFDFKPRPFSKQQRALLQDLAGIAQLSLISREVSVAQQSLSDKLPVVRHDSLLDPLLHVWNRVGLDAIVERQHAAAVAGAPPFSLLMIHVDSLKPLNDGYGRAVGDTMLKAVVRALHGNLRSGDELCRYAGDKFLAVLPATTTVGATRLAQRLMRSVGALSVETSARAKGCTVSIGCTVGIGIADWDSRGVESANSMLDRARAALPVGGRSRARAAARSAPASPEK
jgi:diguanylate cyclase (GGDEF)-like protein